MKKIFILLFILLNISFSYVNASSSEKSCKIIESEEHFWIHDELSYGIKPWFSEDKRDYYYVVYEIETWNKILFVNWEEKWKYKEIYNITYTKQNWLSYIAEDLEWSTLVIIKWSIVHKYTDWEIYINSFKFWKDNSYYYFYTSWLTLNDIVDEKPKTQLIINWIKDNKLYDWIEWNIYRILILKNNKYAFFAKRGVNRIINFNWKEDYVKEVDDISFSTNWEKIKYSFTDYEKGKCNSYELEDINNKQTKKDLWICWYFDEGKVEKVQENGFTYIYIDWIQKYKYKEIGYIIKSNDWKEITFEAKSDDWTKKYIIKNWKNIWSFDDINKYEYINNTHDIILSWRRDWKIIIQKNDIELSNYYNPAFFEEWEFYISKKSNRYYYTDIVWKKEYFISEKWIKWIWFEFIYYWGFIWDNFYYIWSTWKDSNRKDSLMKNWKLYWEYDNIADFKVLKNWDLLILNKKWINKDKSKISLYRNNKKIVTLNKHISNIDNIYWISDNWNKIFFEYISTIEKKEISFYDIYKYKTVSIICDNDEYAKKIEENYKWNNGINIYEIEKKYNEKILEEKNKSEKIKDERVIKNGDSLNKKVIKEKKSENMIEKKINNKLFLSWFFIFIIILWILFKKYKFNKESNSHKKETFYSNK